MKLLASIFLVFSTIFSFGQNNEKQKEANSALVTVGQEAPQFKFEIEKGKNASFKEYKGKVVLINFFATWCAPCRKELPLIQEQIWNKYKQNPKFAMLTFGREHSWEEVDKFKKDQNFQFPLLPDPTRKVYGLFATQTIPRSFLIGEDGKIVFMTTGFEEKQFEELKSILDSKL
jgi:peroxiredoxin